MIFLDQIWRPHDLDCTLRRINLSDVKRLRAWEVGLRALLHRVIRALPVEVAHLLQHHIETIFVLRCVPHRVTRAAHHSERLRRPRDYALLSIVVVNRIRYMGKIGLFVGTLLEAEVLVQVMFERLIVPRADRQFAPR